MSDLTDAELDYLASNLIHPLRVRAAERRARDNEPCDRCGGDQLRADLTGLGRCHAPRAVPKDKERDHD